MPASEWDALLTQLGLADPYYLRAYVESACEIEPGEPVLLEHGGAVMACVVRAIPGTDAQDVTTPYGYGGPAGGGTEGTGGFCQEFDHWCRERGIVSTFIRFHPLLENHRHATGRIHARHVSETIGWPLDGDLMAGMHGKHRNTVRKAQRAGVMVRTRIDPDTLEPFSALYDTTMRRQRASSYYFFGERYWRALGGLSDRLVLFDAVHEGTVVASALCLRGDRWLHYHLGATDDAARDLGASNLLLYEAAGWAQARDLETFHLGGGAGGRDSLFAFKQRFSPLGAREFWVGKAVHDERAYLELSGASEIDYEGFFPAYRVPGGLSQVAGTPRST